MYGLIDGCMNHVLDVDVNLISMDNEKRTLKGGECLVYSNRQVNEVSTRKGSGSLMRTSDS